jgi:hypothetical protein
MYNPLYKQGSLIGISGIMHGVADRITGPYDWFSRPMLQGSHNPMLVVFNDTDGKTKYTLWSKAGLQIADNPHGPFEMTNYTFPGDNCAPMFHNGAWYMVADHMKQLNKSIHGIRTVFTTPALGHPWTEFAEVDEEDVEDGVRVEDVSICGFLSLAPVCLFDYVFLLCSLFFTLTSAATGILLLTPSTWTSTSTAVAADRARTISARTGSTGTCLFPMLTHTRTPCSMTTALHTRIALLSVRIATSTRRGP